MKITKRELLEKMRFACLGTGYVHTSNHGLTWDWERIVCDLAVALGYEVVEGPELPERLELQSWPHGGGVNVVDPANARVFYFEDRGFAALAPEVVRRYNAKAKVLEVAKEAERLGAERWGGWTGEFGELAARLRAAYEEEG